MNNVSLHRDDSISRLRIEVDVAAYTAAAPESTASPAGHARQDSYISPARLAAQRRQQEQRPPAAAQSSGWGKMCYSHSRVLSSFICRGPSAAASAGRSSRLAAALRPGTATLIDCWVATNHAVWRLYAAVMRVMLLGSNTAATPSRSVGTAGKSHIVSSNNGC